MMGKKNTCKGGDGTILHHIRGRTNSIKGTSSDEGSDEERFSLRRPAFERFLHVREAGKAKIEAKKEEATNEICSTELRSGESTARLPGGPLKIQLGSVNRSLRDDYCYPPPSEAYTRNATRTYASRELMST